MADKKALPIWIGLFEASAIATELEKISFSRPMTHDLINELLKSLEVNVMMIEINDLRDNTFFAMIHLLINGNKVAVDSRPSDAIALALRANAPIYVHEKVIDKSRNIEFGKKVPGLETVNSEKLKDFLENLSPEDFGKYKM
jgi:bifunctional DNase/RNase